MSDVNQSTAYYRKNKKQRNTVRCCPHCDYKTTGCKNNLTVHILGKHTLEEDRPFQCQEDNCCRGFAQKSSYERHLHKVHGKNVNRPQFDQKSIVMYIITLKEFQPALQWRRRRRTRRCHYYGNHPIIKTEDLPIFCENRIGPMSRFLQRYPGENDINHCSQCGHVGHNSRTCGRVQTKKEQNTATHKGFLITRRLLQSDARAKYISLETYTRNELVEMVTTEELKQKK